MILLPTEVEADGLFSKYAVLYFKAYVIKGHTSRLTL